MAIAFEPRTVPSELRVAQQRLLRRLAHIRAMLRQHLLVEGVFWTVVTLVASASGSLVLDYFLRPSLPVRLVLLALLVAAIGVVVARRLFRPLLLRLGPLDLAAILDRRSPGTGQRICNVLELPKLIESEFSASLDMVCAAVNDSAAALDKTDFTSRFNAGRKRTLLLGIGALVGLVAGFYVFEPATAGLWARRWFAGSNVRWPQRTYLSIAGLGDGNVILVPRGEGFLLQVEAQRKFEGTAGNWQLAGRAEPLVVETELPPESEPPENVSIYYTLADGTGRRGNATQFETGDFRFDIAPLVEPVDVRISGGDDWLEPIRIEPVARPTVASLEIISKRPGQTEPERQTIGEGSGQVLFLSETEMELRLVADQALASAEALDKGLPASSWQRVDERTYSLKWSMKDSLTLEFRLVGQRGSLESKPYYLAIGLLKDREPRLTIRPSSALGRRITPVARIPLTLRATDDFGVASLALDVEKTELREEQPQVSSASEDLGKDAAPPEGAPRTEWELDHEFSLRERGFGPGTLVKLRGRATDNCLIGAQSGASRWLSFQVVSSDELFYEILMRLREQRAKFNLATESSKAQTTALAALSKGEDAAPLARTQQVINRQVSQVATQLETVLEEMTLNDISNPQAREMLQSGIVTPMRTLHNDLLARLRTAEETLSRQSTVSEELRTEAQNLSEQAVASMQAILAQMAQWESFVDVINQLRQIIQRQNDVLTNTEEVQKKRTNELFDE